jgi:hypothetical protein
MADERITRQTMFEPLLEADPSFRVRWDEFLADWGDEPDPPLYLALSSLARHVLAILEAGDTQRASAILTVVERWHVDGDAYVQEAATIGLLEALQGHALKSKPGSSVEPCLGPESRRWWDKLNRFWSGDPSALAEPPSS